MGNFRVGKKFIIFVGKLSYTKFFTHENLSVAYRNTSNAVQAMKSNEIYTHENRKSLFSNFLPHENYLIYGTYSDLHHSCPEQELIQYKLTIAFPPAYK